MRRMFFVLVAFFFLLIASCKKDNQVAPTSFFMEAKLNGSNWAGQPYTGYAGDDSLHIQARLPNTQDNIAFVIKYNGTANYQLKGSQSTFYILDASNVDICDYKMDPSFNNHISITAFDATTKIASGNFEVHFVRAYGISTYADKLDFVNGTFRAQLPVNLH
jgi:hypothetical protein